MELSSSSWTGFSSYKRVRIVIKWGVKLFNVYACKGGRASVALQNICSSANPEPEAWGAGARDNLLTGKDSSVSGACPQLSLVCTSLKAPLQGFLSPPQEGKPGGDGNQERETLRFLLSHASCPVLLCRWNLKSEGGNCSNTHPCASSGFSLVTSCLGTSLHLKAKPDWKDFSGVNRWFK